LVSKKKQQQGLTLIEVMVTLVILAITAAIIAPAIDTVYVNFRLKSSARTLFADLNLAKINALKSLVPHTVLLGGASGTQQGWIVFRDSNDNGVFDSGEKELRNVRLEGGVTFQGGLNTPITFDRRGLINRGTGTYILESQKQGKSISLTVTPVGFIHIQ
jgi:type IV fimbrial biogenesis protein FimT